MKITNIKDYKGLIEKESGATFIFTTAFNDFNFNKSTDIGKKNLNLLKDYYELDKIAYCDQCHSDIVNIYEGNIDKADALITNKVNTAVGVFTADCVPILLYDKRNKIVAAVHSGWRGTLNLILLKTLEKMKNTYKTSSEDIVAYIGPHIKKCCYEVGQEVIREFENSEFYKNKEVFLGRNLDLTKCIYVQLENFGVEDKSIHSADVCTFCTEEENTFSYRRGDTTKRLFSLVFFK